MKTLIKLFVTIVFLFVIFKFTDIETLKNTIKNINWSFLILAVIFQLLSNITAALRWNIIMSALDFKENVFFYIKSYFKGTFFNQALPSSIGGDAVRILELGELGYKKTEAFYGIFIDRIIGLLGLLLLNLAANLMNSNLLPSWLFNLINIISILSILGLFGLALIRKINFLENYAVLKNFYELSKRFRSVYRTKSKIILQLALSVIIHLFSVMSVYVISKAIGMDYSFGVFLVIVPPVFLFMLIPVSLAGWGVREGAMIGFFMLIGAVREQVLSLSVLYGIIVIICSLPGMIFWLLSKNKL